MTASSARPSPWTADIGRAVPNPTLSASCKFEIMFVFVMSKKSAHISPSSLLASIRTFGCNELISSFSSSRLYGWQPCFRNHRATSVRSAVTPTFPSNMNNIKSLCRTANNVCSIICDSKVPPRSPLFFLELLFILKYDSSRSPSTPAVSTIRNNTGPIRPILSRLSLVVPANPLTIAPPVFPLTLLDAPIRPLLTLLRNFRFFSVVNLYA
mmetsp:Transcript_13264/g.17357  ORF Transcript_13264/g.17357 Transcript_13264/m.17357 type:complete len:211 (+) Transcript_13264:1130-1762(+)